MSSISLRSIATLVAAVFLGLIAVFLARAYLNNAERSNVSGLPAGSAVPVVVAAVDIPRGAPLRTPMLKVANYPADAAPAGAFHTVAELTGAPAQQRLAL